MNIDNKKKSSSDISIGPAMQELEEVQEFYCGQQSPVSAKSSSKPSLKGGTEEPSLKGDTEVTSSKENTTKVYFGNQPSEPKVYGEMRKQPSQKMKVPGLLCRKNALLILCIMLLLSPKCEGKALHVCMLSSCSYHSLYIIAMNILKTRFNVTVFSPGDVAIYQCHPPFYTTNIQWIINGSSLENLNLSNVQAEVNSADGTAALRLNVLTSYNGTSIQCVANGSTLLYSNIIQILIEGNQAKPHKVVTL